MTTALTFKKIRVIRSAGFSPPGFAVEGLEPQINIIYGPNGAGKTTLAQAFGYLLWPSSVAPERASVQGVFALNGAEWFVSLDAGAVTCQREGTASPPPDLPPAEHYDRYYLALHELLQEGVDARSFAEVIRRESLGGYRIADAVEELGFQEQPSRKGKVTRQAQQKIEAYHEARQRQEKLADEEQRLDRLRGDLEEIRAAQQRLGAIEQAIEFVETDHHYHQLAAELSSFPDALEKMRGDEEEQLRSLEERIGELSRDTREAEQLRAAAEETLEDLGLPEDGVSESFLTELKTKRERLKTLEDRVSQLKNDLAGARVEREEERRNFAGLLAPEQPDARLAELDGAAYNELSSFARRAERVYGRLWALESLKRVLAPEEALTTRREEVGHGIQLLESWLRTPGDELQKKKRKVRRIAWGSGLTLAATALALGITVNPWFLLLLLAAGAVGWYGREPATGEPDLRMVARQAFEQMGIPGPEAWEEPAVRSRLDELCSARAKNELSQRQREYWEDRKEEYLRLKEERAALDREGSELRARYGAAPEVDERGLYYLTNRLSRWQDADRKVRKLEACLQGAQAAYRGLLKEINEELAPYNYCPAAGAAGITGYLADLEERNSRYREAVRDRQTAREKIASCCAGLKEARDERTKIYRRLNLEAGDRASLKELSAHYQEFTELKRQLEKADYLRTREREKLEEVASDPGVLVDKGLKELRAERMELRTRAEDLEAVQEQIKGIEARMAAAMEGRRVEEDLAEMDRALDTLEARLNRDYASLAGWVLADHVRRVSTAQNRPEVFRRAREIFATITRGNYRLVISSSEPPSFRAVETVSGLGRSLEELSSGTRIQLLLAVRLAFVEQKEGGVRLPLYLDETLANADDHRSEAIIESVIELARRGRQCFYFTARQDEVGRWLATAEGLDGVEAGVIELGRSRNREQKPVVEQLDDILPDAISVPPLEDMTHAEFGAELEPPPFDPRQGAETAHLWYLVEDPELLSHLLRLGIERWGQLKTLLDTGRDGCMPSGKREQLEKVRQLGRCLEVFVECWQVGQGLPVDRTVLLVSGAVSENFIDEVTGLAAELDGDAEAIIEALRSGEVSRFLSKKIDELERYFIQNGYIDSAGPLSGEEIYARMISAVRLEQPDQVRASVRRLLERLQAQGLYPQDSGV